MAGSQVDDRHQGLHERDEPLVPADIDDQQVLGRAVHDLRDHPSLGTGRVQHAQPNQLPVEVLLFAAGSFVRRNQGDQLSSTQGLCPVTVRHLLEAHDLGAALFAKVGELLLASGMRLSGGTIVDATLIAAPPSIKNKEKSRDPEMHQTKKGNQWHFGMKLHIGADSQTGLVHSASVTAANVHDRHQVPHLLHGRETRLYGDSAYRGKEQRERLRELAPRAQDFTNKRAYKNQPLSEADKATNRRKSSVRSKVEHPFLTLKRLWGFAKVRYRGLAKNANRAFALLAMINISKWGRPLTGKVCPA